MKRTVLKSWKLFAIRFLCVTSSSLDNNNWRETFPFSGWEILSWNDPWGLAEPPCHLYQPVCNCAILPYPFVLDFDTYLHLSCFIQFSVKIKQTFIQVCTPPFMFPNIMIVIFFGLLEGEPSCLVYLWDAHLVLVPGNHSLILWWFFCYDIYWIQTFIWDCRG